jgi:hypothetical protein
VCTLGTTLLLAVEEQERGRKSALQTAESISSDGHRAG